MDEFQWNLTKYFSGKGYKTINSNTVWQITKKIGCVILGEGFYAIPECAILVLLITRKAGKTSATQVSLKIFTEIVQVQMYKRKLCEKNHIIWFSSSQVAFYSMDAYKLTVLFWFSKGFCTCDWVCGCGEKLAGGSVAAAGGPSLFTRFDCEETPDPTASAFAAASASPLAANCAAAAAAAAAAGNGFAMPVPTICWNLSKEFLKY